MSDIERGEHNDLIDVAPGSPHDSLLSETLSYVVGLGLAVLLTAISFWVASTGSLWGPGVAVGLVVLAIAQMGVHLVFFLHITSGPDNTNNVLALAFGVLIVFLVMVGTIWIMAHMSANMGPSPEMMNLQMQH
jgi:cytochrome o ubiquinol oxidase operon protein cyoD